MLESAKLKKGCYKFFRDYKNEIKEDISSLKVIYSDLDGTLFNDQGCIVKDARGKYYFEAVGLLGEINKKGWDLVLVSGRNKYQLRYNAQMIGVKNYIAELGSELVYDLGKDVHVTFDNGRESFDITYEGKDIGDPYIIIERRGLRIGFIGLTLVKGSGRVPHGFVLGDPGESLDAAVTELEGEVDLLVGLFHTGLETGKELVANNQAFDVVILGHGGKKLHEPFTMGKTIVLKGESQGRSLGRLVLEIGPDRTIKENRSELIPLGADLKDHSEMKTFIDEYDKKRKEQVEKIQSRHTELQPETR